MQTQELSRESIADELTKLRPGWDRPGVVGQLERALRTHSLELVRQVALVAAGDPRASSPGVIAWRCDQELKRQAAKKEAPRTVRPPAHCGYSSCSCEHRECFKGWLTINFNPSPCGNCKPALVAILAMTDISEDERHQMISERTTP